MRPSASFLLLHLAGSLAAPDHGAEPAGGNAVPEASLHGFNRREDLSSATTPARAVCEIGRGGRLGGLRLAAVSK